jgi:hypothetical protein
MATTTPPNTQVTLGTGPDIEHWHLGFYSDVERVADSETVKIDGVSITVMAEFIMNKVGPAAGRGGGCGSRRVDNKLSGH